MARVRGFNVEGLVVAVLSDRTCRVELANGHRLLGFAGRKARAEVARVRPGDRVRLALSPYDLSTGEIIVQREIG